MNGKGWVVKIDNQDVTYEVLKVATKDIDGVLTATKKYVDRTIT